MADFQDVEVANLYEYHLYYNDFLFFFASGLFGSSLFDFIASLIVSLFYAVLNCR